MVLNKSITFWAEGCFQPLRAETESIIVETRPYPMCILKSLSSVAITLVLALPAWSQAPSEADAAQPATPLAQNVVTTPEAQVTPAVRMIEDFKASDVRFDLNELVDILRDHRHEGWVLAAYPDPRTGQPLIGAGFSLDLPEREHPQPDPMNPHPFLEASSADLWQAAGFDAARLNGILDVFYERKRTWTKRKWRRQLFSLPAQISDDDATALVRVGAIQAIYNARAYCRSFDQLNGPQQMAMAQLVYQMGINLEHFNAFLGMINPGPGPRSAALDSPMFAEDASSAADAMSQTPEYWLAVQKSLMGSQWAHKYRTRAISVIAMLDPAYSDDPSAAEHRVGAVLRPAVVHRRRGRAVATTREAAVTARHHHSRKSLGTRSRARNRKRA